MYTINKPEIVKTANKKPTFNEGCLYTIFLTHSNTSSRFTEWIRSIIEVSKGCNVCACACVCCASRFDLKNLLFFTTQASASPLKLYRHQHSHTHTHTHTNTRYNALTHKHTQTHTLTRYMALTQTIRHKKTKNLKRCLNKYPFSCHKSKKKGEKTGISNTRTSKKKRGHRNGNIEFKIEKVNIENNTSIPVRLLGTGLGTIIIPQYRS